LRPLGRLDRPTAPPALDQFRPTPLDGKTLCSSDDKLRAAVHLLSLLDGATGGVLKQAVDTTTNEHKAAFALLEGLAFRGRVSLPMRCSATAIWPERSAKGGHYFFVVKEHQGQLKRDSRDSASAFEPAFPP
jgi:hypothetical protein